MGALVEEVLEGCCVAHMGCQGEAGGEGSGVLVVARGHAWCWGVGGVNCGDWGGGLMGGAAGRVRRILAFLIVGRWVAGREVCGGPPGRRCRVLGPGGGRWMRRE